VVDVIVTEWWPRLKKAYYAIAKRLTIKKYWRKLLKELMKLNVFFVPWWTGGSIVETSFAQFKIFYEIYKDKFYPTKEVLKHYWKGPEWDEFSPSQRKNHIFYLDWLEQSYNLINDVYKYITVTRDANRALVDAIQDEMFDGCDMSLTQKDPNNIFEGMKSFNIKYHFSEYGHLIIDSKKPTKKKNGDWLKLEMACDEKDAEVAKQLIDIRELLCD
jgi:hypothetical protein